MGTVIFNSLRFDNKKQAQKYKKENNIDGNIYYSKVFRKWILEWWPK